MVLITRSRTSLARLASSSTRSYTSRPCSPFAVLLASSSGSSSPSLVRTFARSPARRIQSSLQRQSSKPQNDPIPSTAASAGPATGAQAELEVVPAVEPENATYPMVVYVGPISKALYSLKAFSLSSLAVSSLLSPFIFVLEADLGFAGRCFLAGVAIATTITSTGLIGWCASPYVSTIELLEPPSKQHPNPAIRMLTYTTFLQPRYTTLTTPLFLHPSQRPMASWELRPAVTPPLEAFPDIVAQTADKNGIVLGQWDGEGPDGLLTGDKKVQRTFMVHEELLKGVWGLDGWRSNKAAVPEGTVQK